MAPSTKSIEVVAPPTVVETPKVETTTSADNVSLVGFTLGTLIPSMEKAGLEPKLEARIVDIGCRVQSRLREFARLRSDIAKTLHADQVQDVADLLNLLVTAGIQAGSVVSKVNEIWRAYLTGSNEAQSIVPAVILNGEEVAAQRTVPNRFYHQFFRRWNDLSRWQAGSNFYRQPTDTNAGEVYPKDGVKIGDTVYHFPVDALRDGHTLSSVHTAFINVIRPPKPIDLDRYMAGLESAARRAMINLKVVVKPELGKGAGRTAPRRQMRPIAGSLQGIRGAMAGLLDMAKKDAKLYTSIREYLQKQLADSTQHTE
jgi:hypothetical protein